MAEYFWQELCIICGVAPSGYGRLFPEDSEDMILNLANAIGRLDPSLPENLKNESLISILSEPQTQYVPFPPELEGPRVDTSLYPGGLEGDHIAIGHFMSTGSLPCGCPRPSNNPVSKSLFIDGKGVQTLIVSEPSNGDFQRSEGYLGDTNAVAPDWVPCSATIGEGFGNFFVCRECYYLLHAWLDRSRFVKTTQLEFAEEFYEVVNSREKGRHIGRGNLLWINYDGIEETLEFDSEYDYLEGEPIPIGENVYFGHNLKEPRYIVEAIRQGLRGDDLLPAFFRDYRCWMIVPRSFWPTQDNAPDSSHRDAPRPLVIENLTRDEGFGALANFPNEILLEIAICLPLPDYFKLARTSRSFYALLASPMQMDWTFRRMSTNPSRALFWVRPVEVIPGELQAANKALQTWLPQNADLHPGETGLTTTSALDNKTFPMYAFIKTCYGSHSMMNRRRIWGIVKQFEDVWADYRLNGWQVDRFAKHHEDLPPPSVT